MKTLVRRHPLASYFGFAFLLSWGGFSLAVAPRLLRGESVRALDTLIVFPILVLGVGIGGALQTVLIDGADGLRELRSRMDRWQVGLRWYAVALASPTCLILAILSSLRALAPDFGPNHVWVGALFGVLPGFSEEIGWTGFALPRMLSGRSALAASIRLGLLWGLWHLPVVDSTTRAARLVCHAWPCELRFPTPRNACSRRRAGLSRSSVSSRLDTVRSRRGKPPGFA